MNSVQTHSLWNHSSMSLKSLKISVFVSSDKFNCFFTFKLMSPNWVWAQICLTRDQWFLRTSENVAVCKFHIVVKRRLVEAEKYFRAECRGTEVVQTLRTKNELPEFRAHSENKVILFIQIQRINIKSHLYQIGALFNYNAYTNIIVFTIKHKPKNVHGSTCRTGLVTRYFSRNALGDMSKERQVDKCCKMDSMVCRGCWRVTLKYFWRGREIVGKIDWAASYDSIGVFSFT